MRDKSLLDNRIGQVPLEAGRPEATAVLPVAKRLRTGQALIETLVAVSVLIVGFLGLVTLLTHSLGLNRVVTENYTATYLAAEGIEVVKNILDAQSLHPPGDWDAIRAGTYEVQYDDIHLDRQATGRFLAFDPSVNLYSYSGPAEGRTNFKRTVVLTVLQSGEEVKVNSKVDWVTRGGGNFSIDLEDHFFNWRKHAQ